MQGQPRVRSSGSLFAAPPIGLVYDRLGDALVQSVLNGASTH